jgi:ribosomal protein S27AE
MKILIKENQYKKLLETITNEKVICDKCGSSWDLSDGGDNPFICHKCGYDNEETLEPTSFTYVTMKPFKKHKTERYYFNDVLNVPDNSPIKGKIKLNGADGNFILDKNELFFDDVKHNISINKNDFYKNYPEYKKTNNAEKIGITPSSIRKALSIAFPKKGDKGWFEETLGTEGITAGLRGYYTIGEKIGDGEDWSIMNYFDTKDEIHNLLYLKYIESGEEEPIVDWLENLFKNDESFTQLLVDRQWKSISSGLKLERDSVDNFLNKKGGGNVKYYPHGSKMDRWFGVDVTIDGINYQIKPLFSYSKEVESFSEPIGASAGMQTQPKQTDVTKYFVKTYGMKNYITKKSKVNKIVFSNEICKLRQSFTCLSSKPLSFLSQSCYSYQLSKC